MSNEPDIIGPSPAAIKAGAAELRRRYMDLEFLTEAVSEEIVAAICREMRLSTCEHRDRGHAS